MANDVIAFNDAANLPAYIRDLAGLAGLFAETGKEVANFASYPSLSIKGKTWTRVEGGERKVMFKPGGEEGEIAQFIDVAIIRANDNARTFYSKRFTEQSAAEGEKPTCYSMDGITPSARSTEIQSPKCATCPHAVWGSAVNEDGTAGKGTACAQNARLAVAAVDAIDKPHLLRVPPKSLKPMRDAIAVLRERKLPYPVAVFRLGFDPESASPVITFRPVGLLPDAKMAESVKMRETLLVRQIVGLDEQGQAATQATAAAETKPETNELDAAIAARAAEAAALAESEAKQNAAAHAAYEAEVAAKAKAAAAKAAADAKAAAAKVTPPAEPKVTVVHGDASQSDLLAELNGLLGNPDK
jgi:hypothetical protein